MYTYRELVRVIQVYVRHQKFDFLSTASSRVFRVGLHIAFGGGQQIRSRLCATCTWSVATSMNDSSDPRAYHWPPPRSSRTLVSSMLAPSWIFRSSLARQGWEILLCVCARVYCTDRVCAGALCVCVGWVRACVCMHFQARTHRLRLFHVRRGRNCCLSSRKHCQPGCAVDQKRFHLLGRREGLSWLCCATVIA